MGAATIKLRDSTHALQHGGPFVEVVSVSDECARTRSAPVHADLSRQHRAHLLLGRDLDAFHWILAEVRELLEESRGNRIRPPCEWRPFLPAFSCD